MRVALPLLLVAACTATPSLPAGERIGEPIEPRETIAYAMVGGDPSAWLEQTVLVEATVVAVCQNAGCWMQVEDGGRTAMVRWFTECGGKYTFPKGLAGRRVLIQGSLHPLETSPDEAEHLAQEARRELEIPVQGLELNASAILVVD